MEDKDDILGKSDPKDLSFSENSMQYQKHLIKYDCWEEDKTPHARIEECNNKPKIAHGTTPV